MTMTRSIILIGDQNQLPPHVERELERKLDEDLRRKVDLTTASLFSFLWESLGGPLVSTNCVTLDTQFRMYRDIGTLVSRAFYGGDLKHACPGGPGSKWSPAFGLFDDEPFVWVDTADVLQDKSRRRKGRHDWPCHENNPYEVDLVVAILERLSDGAIEELKRRQSP